jgi:hypothetical protein
LQDGFEAEGDMTCDVFEEHPLWGTFADNPCDLGPEVAGVVGSGPLPGRAEGLAGISGEDCVEGPSEGLGFEAAQIIPDRSRGKVSGALGRDEDGSGPVLPFDEAPGVIAGLGEHKAQIQASAACAEGQSVPGT